MYTRNRELCDIIRKQIEIKLNVESVENNTYNQRRLSLAEEVRLLQCDEIEFKFSHRELKYDQLHEENNIYIIA